MAVRQAAKQTHIQTPACRADDGSQTKKKKRKNPPPPLARCHQTHTLYPCSSYRLTLCPIGHASVEKCAGAHTHNHSQSVCNMQPLLVLAYATSISTCRATTHTHARVLVEDDNVWDVRERCSWLSPCNRASCTMHLPAVSSLYVASVFQTTIVHVCSACIQDKRAASYSVVLAKSTQTTEVLGHWEFGSSAERDGWCVQ